MNQEQFDQAYMKDKHSSVRVVYQETFTLGDFKSKKSEGYSPKPKKNSILCAVVALYVMDLDILCVDAKVLSSEGHLPYELQENMGQRVLETQTFPAAVRRSIILADQLRDQLKASVAEKLLEEFTPAP